MLAVGGGIANALALGIQERVKTHSKFPFLSTTDGPFLHEANIEDSHSWIA